VKYAEENLFKMPLIDIEVTARKMQRKTYSRRRKNNN
jgi:hypothetical protein